MEWNKYYCGFPEPDQSIEKFTNETPCPVHIRLREGVNKKGYRFWQVNYCDFYRRLESRFLKKKGLKQIPFFGIPIKCKIPYGIFWGVGHLFIARDEDKGWFVHRATRGAVASPPVAIVNKRLYLVHPDARDSILDMFALIRKIDNEKEIHHATI